MLIFIGVLGLVALIAIVVRPDGEPSYGGRSLSYWVGRLVPAGEPAAAVEEAIRHIGTNALPYLLEWIQQERPLSTPSKRQLYEITGGLLKKYDIWLEHKEYILAGQATEALQILASQAGGTIPQLLRLMTNYFDGPSTAERASKVIVSMGTNARPALPALITLLTNKTRGVDILGIKVLGELKLEPQLVVPALANCLVSSNETARFAAARALRRFGENAGNAVPALLRVLDDSDADVQRCASNSLRAIDAQALERFNARAAEAGKNVE
jgi:hypothetical protein